MFARARARARARANASARQNTSTFIQESRKTSITISLRPFLQTKGDHYSIGY